MVHPLEGVDNCGDSILELLLHLERSDGRQAMQELPEIRKEGAQ
jgi:hypothetical protein